MEWVDALRGTVVAVDTAPLIYFIEEHPRYLPHLRAFFGAVDKGDFRIVTSILTLTEVLIHPLRQGNSQLAAITGGSCSMPKTLEQYQYLHLWQRKPPASAPGTSCALPIRFRSPRRSMREQRHF